MRLVDLFTPEQFAEVLRGKVGRMGLAPDSPEAKAWSAELEEYFNILRTMGIFRACSNETIAYMVTVFRAIDAAVRYTTEELKQ